MAHGEEIGYLHRGGEAECGGICAEVVEINDHAYEACQSEEIYHSVDGAYPHAARICQHGVVERSHQPYESQSGEGDKYKQKIVAVGSRHIYEESRHIEVGQ